MNSADILAFNDLSAIKEHRDNLKAQIASLQAQLKVSSNTLQDMYEDTARMQLAQQGKDFGQTTINTETHKVSLDFRKRVEWDQDKLKSILDSLDPDTARHYATIKLSIAEAKFQNAPPEIKAALSEARTVHLQGVSVDIQDRD